MTPQRIQRRRSRGWKMPANAIYVGRPTRWGNPFNIEEFRFRSTEPDPEFSCACTSHRRTDAECRQEAVAAFEGWVHSQPDLLDDIKTNLKGRDLACWCPPGQPCHADILLHIANA
jgi:hypothetical protein